jgi:HEAT repeats
MKHLTFCGGGRMQYPHIHPMDRHTPEDFLTILERRTGLFVQSGHLRHNGQSVPVYEFRHLALQEYLAGIALLQGHYPGHDLKQSLVDCVGHLAGLVGVSNAEAPSENWREALRLCVAASNDSIVDSLLQAIVRRPPRDTTNGRARAVLAALCLMDEPNASNQVIHEVITAFVTHVEIRDVPDTTLNQLALGLGRSRWSNRLVKQLAEAFLQTSPSNRERMGALTGWVLAQTAPRDDLGWSGWLIDQATILRSGSESAAVAVALALMRLASEQRQCATPEIIDGLIARLAVAPPLAHAPAWALSWIYKQSDWRPLLREQDHLVAAATSPNCDPEAVRHLIAILGAERNVGILEVALAYVHSSAPTAYRRMAVASLGRIGDDRAIEGLMATLSGDRIDTGFLSTVIEAFVDIGGPAARAALRKCLDNEAASVRRAAILALAELYNLADDDQRLLSQNLDGKRPGFDPRNSITLDRLSEAALACFPSGSVSEGSPPVFSTRRAIRSVATFSVDHDRPMRNYDRPKRRDTDALSELQGLDAGQPSGGGGAVIFGVALGRRG